jgi:mRNA-degrading endonuclease RelE of RelBE toxin-antitoxin system
MYKLGIKSRVLKEMRRYPPKIFKQIAAKIFSLSFNPRLHDSKRVGLGYRVDVGEYRIFYQVDDDAKKVSILVVGKRGKDEIYKLIRRLGLL